MVRSCIESTLKEPQAFQNSIKGEVDLGKEANKWLSTLARDMTASQILEAKQRIKAFAPRKSDAEPSTESATEILLDDPSKMLDVRIHRILVGQRVVDDGRYWQHQLDEVQKQGKELIYFDVSVKNLGRLGEHQFWHLSFALEDSDGNSYSCDQTVDYLRGTVHQGKIGRGGIAFAVYQNHRPKSLVYDTGMTVGVSRQKVFARTDELQSLPIFAGSNRASLTVPLRIP